MHDPPVAEQVYSGVGGNLSGDTLGHDGWSLAYLGYHGLVLILFCLLIHALLGMHDPIEG